MKDEIPSLQEMCQTTKFIGNNTLLEAAIKTGNAEQAALVIAHTNSDINRLVDHYPSALFMAVYYGNIDIVVELIEKNCDINIQATEVGNAEKDKYSKFWWKKGYGLIHAAVQYGRKDIVLKLLEINKGLTEQQDEEGMTALHIACGYERHDIIDALIAHNGNINAKNAKGKTPVYVAISNYDLVGMKKMIASGCDTSMLSSYTPIVQTYLSFAVKEIVETLLQYGADPDVPNTSNGNTTMHDAAISSTDILQIVFPLCKNPNAQNKKGETALFLAAQLDKIENLKILISSGRCDIDIQDNSGATALFLALKKNKIEHARLLIKAGANIYLADNDNANLLHYAVLVRKNMEYENIRADAPTSELIEEILTPKVIASSWFPMSIFRAKPQKNRALELLDAQDKNGNSPLHNAVKAKKPESVKVLLKYGSSTTAKNSIGYTPLKIAQNYGFQHIIGPLKQANPKAKI